MACRMGGFSSGAWVDALVDVQGDGRCLERSVSGLAGPGELRVDVGVVGVALAARVPVRSSA